MNDLKPCPFCGGKARLFVNGGVRVICSKCCVGTMILTDSLAYESNAVETVIKAWNRRADVVHGRWEMRPTGMATDTGPEYKAYCTICNEPNKQYRPPFCPHCGAKMDGGANHEAG